MNPDENENNDYALLYEKLLSNIDILTESTKGILYLKDYTLDNLESDNIENYISGIIIKSCNVDNFHIIDIIKKKNILLGVQADINLDNISMYSNELVTEGIDGLKHRLSYYSSLGVSFCIWNTYIEINKTQNFPSKQCLSRNILNITSFASLAQELGIIPLINVEFNISDQILLSDLATYECICRDILSNIMRKLIKSSVILDFVVLNITPLKINQNEPLTNDILYDLSLRTLRLFQDTIPVSLPIIYMSHVSNDDATMFKIINELNTKKPWKISFCIFDFDQDLLSVMKSLSNV